jgi:threonine dehydrogenase-like Zn-dependent dehydrogenase
VKLVEPSARRREAAQALGLADVVTPADDVARASADVVIEATGEPSALDRAIAHAGPEATVTVASFYGARAHPVALGGDFHRRRLVLRASQVSSIPPALTPRWTLARRFEEVRRLLADARLDALVGDPVPFDEAPRAYEMLDAASDAPAQMVFRYC